MRVEDLPTIIIHPSLYQPERRFLLQRVCEGFLTLTKIALVVTSVGTATFAIGQVIETRSLAARGRSHARAPAFESARELSTTHAYAVQSPAETPSMLRDTSALTTVTPVAAPASPLVTEIAQGAVPKPALGRARDLMAAVRDARRMFALNRLEEAEAAYRKLLTVSDKQPAALLGLARVQLARGQLDEALELAERAVDRAPNQVSCHLTLGDVLRARGALQAAGVQYQLATLLNPTNSPQSAPFADSGGTLP